MDAKQLELEAKLAKIENRLVKLQNDITEIFRKVDLILEVVHKNALNIMDIPKISIPNDY
jgi:hypothetical protein